jgi:hypothetical protein
MSDEDFKPNEVEPEIKIKEDIEKYWVFKMLDQTGGTIDIFMFHKDIHCWEDARKKAKRYFKETMKTLNWNATLEYFGYLDGKAYGEALICVWEHRGESGAVKRC